VSLRASIEPTRTAAYAGIPVTATVTVANTAHLVDAFEIRVLGVDRDWVRCSPERLQLFPETTGTFDLTIDLPDDFPSGLRVLTIQIRSDLKPEHPTLLTLTLDVDARPRLNVQVQPTQVVGGSQGSFAVTVQNLGNTESTARLVVSDPEALVRGLFDRPEIDIPPGEQRSTPLRVSAKRPWAGAPMVRNLSIAVEEGIPGSEQLVTFVQTPRISRLMFSFIGLLIAASIFGVVFSRNLKNVVDATTTDDKVLEQAFGNADPNAGFLPSQITGTVVARSSKDGIAGATIEVYLTAVPDRPIRSVATGDDGTFIVDNLGPGPFRLRAVAAGYDSRWFGDVADFDNSPDVKLESGSTRSAVDMLLGGQPATVQGVVVGGLVDGASVDLIVPAASTGGTNDAVIGNVLVDETGVFEFTNVPAPGTYNLRIRKVGSITTQLSIQLAGGEKRSGITVQLRSGDGQIDGQIVTPDGPLGAATITVTSPDASTATLSLTTGRIGSFVLPDLLTPSSYAITVSAEGYATKALTVSLASGQKVSGLTILLEPATGSISGIVKDSTGAPLRGVAVSATDGENTFATSTVSIDDPSTTSLNEIGTFSLAGLPAPGVYTVSFGGGTYATVVRNVVLSSGSLAAELNIDLVASTGRVLGKVTDASGAVGGVTVKVSNGIVTRTTTTASSCPPNVTDCIGRYRLDGLAPGTYTLTFSRTGSEPAARQIVIVEGGSVTADVVLRPRASITVYVCTSVAATSPSRCGSGAKSGYQVRIWKETDYLNGEPSGSAFTSNAGAVVFNGLDAPGRYVIEVAAVAGNDAITSRVVSLNASQALVVGIAVP
jgi:Carboxypeptidase regulatory-like domain